MLSNRHIWPVMVLSKYTGTKSHVWGSCRRCPQKGDMSAIPARELIAARRSRENGQVKRE